jgi:hypothetical protein
MNERFVCALLPLERLEVAQNALDSTAQLLILESIIRARASRRHLPNVEV